MLTPQPPDDGLVNAMMELENESRKIGLYLTGWIVGQANQEEPVDFVMVTFLVGEEAFDDRILNPEKYEESNQFREIVDDVDEVADFIEEMKRRKAEGKGILDD